MIAKIKEYKILENSSLGMLSTEVNAFLGQGWSIFGTVQKAPYSISKTVHSNTYETSVVSVMYSQVMVRYDTPEIKQIVKEDLVPKNALIEILENYGK